MCCLRSISFSFCKRGRWGTLSKALRKSKKTKETSRPASSNWRMLWNVWNVEVRAVTVDFPGQNPHWSTERSSLSASCSTQYYECAFPTINFAGYREERYWPIVWRVIGASCSLRNWDNRGHFRGTLPLLMCILKSTVKELAIECVVPCVAEQ